MGFIYKVTNLVNGKVYIGQTIGNINKRWREHKSSSLNNLDNNILHKAMRKYGFENFKIEKVIECENDLLDEMEIKYIKIFNSYVGNENSNGYNMTVGGSGTIKNDYSIIYSLWDEGLSAGQIATKTGYNRNTISKILKDYENFSITESNHRAYLLSGKSRGTSVVQLDLNGNIIKEYSTIAEASRETGISHSAICNVINKKIGFKTAGGYKWEKN